jgi:DNA mismatch endonuclease, patch repair protein
MADIVSRQKRSKMMSGIRGKNTKPEIKVRQFLHSKGLRFRIHVRDLPGRPDIVLPKYRTVVFVHGCFWHRHPNCRFAYRPKSNINFWEAKLNGNSERDAKYTKELVELGWNVIVVWECQAENTHILEQVVRDIATFPAREPSK